eukprot:Seg2545.2 transcript_id=Seg2545.2/GoldUCD/mRNA.D3Y31 product="hypothetical protein" protein_id=Seg2545.2/GoldUCD/D3Y31
MIDTMQNYHALAIRQNRNNLPGMVNDVKAGLYMFLLHMPKNQKHQLCPEGKESWCEWQRDIANSTNTYKPKQGLPKAIVDVVEPIYDALSDESLFSRCLDWLTQNPNESLNNLIWKRCPKKIYQGKKVVQLCTASAVSSFNDGASSVAAVLKHMGVMPGRHTVAGIMTADKNRITCADKKSSEKAKQRRKKLRAIKKDLAMLTGRKKDLSMNLGRIRVLFTSC